ncbi:hypothetical protein OROMI_033221 [Orobanche minor]
MAKAAMLCIATLLLLPSFSHVLARRHPAFHDVTPMDTHREDNEVPKGAMDRDSGLGEDECLMRKHLEAQLDYIYTQEKKQP